MNWRLYGEQLEQDWQNIKREGPFLVAGIAAVTASDMGYDLIRHVQNGESINTSHDMSVDAVWLGISALVAILALRSSSKAA